MNFKRDLSANISAAGLSVFVGLTVLVCWNLGLLTLPPNFALFSSSPPDPLTPWTSEISSAVIVIFSLIIGVSVRLIGIRNCYAYLLSVFAILAVAQLFALRFFQLDLLFTPLFVAALITVSLVQFDSLRRLDRKMVEMLLRSTHDFESIKTSDVNARLESSLRVLSLILPLSEAVIFQRDDSRGFEAVARFKETINASDDATRNALWRDAIKLCQRAYQSRDLVFEALPSGGSNVAVPLIHEREVTGVLLIRLNTAFSEVDRPLLEVVSDQLQRNLARESLAREHLNKSFLDYFSTTAGEKKIEVMDVLRIHSIEQQCETRALTQMHDGIAIAYLDGTLALINSSLLQFAELTTEQSANLDLFTLLNRFRNDVFDEPVLAIRRVLQTGVDYERELSFKGGDQILGLRIFLLRQTSKKVIGLAISVRDLTRIKEYEKLKSDMISLMSHELRTPLTSINGFAEVLSADDAIPESAKEFVSIIVNESQRMSRMINTFLSMTQLERKDKQEVLKIPLRLDEVVRETVASLQPVAKKKRIRLVEQLHHRVPPVAADKSLITQAVKNLLHNAIKYSPERTTVTISTVLEAESIRVSVEDRGLGIPAEARDRIWEKFYRVVREGQEKDDESTGLGLAFVRQVIEQHGGTVGVDSEEGRGSKFSFSLPRL